MQHPEYAQSQPDGGERRADPVQPGALRGRYGRRDHPPAQQHGHHDEYLTGEDQPPGEVGRHPAAQQWADRDPGGQQSPPTTA
ncbi:hypothetical protein R2F25_37105 [Streptomyces sp. UP1A-1]|nr:hypothetical protein [Streptomyces sp. UP1A-1]